MPFTIIRNDITAVKADAIVNTANPYPVIGAGTDLAIHTRAGPKLLAARKKIGNIAPGCSVATSAFGLNAKYVLHTVSPEWVDGQHHEVELLRQAYDSALNLAAELHCESVAFPLMAAGSYRFPKELALRAALDAFNTFLMKHSMTVFLVVFDMKAFHLACGLFSDVKSYIDENYVSEQREIEYGSPRSPFRERITREQSTQTEYLYASEESAPQDAFFSPPPRESRRKESRKSESLHELLNDISPTFSEKVLALSMQREGKLSQIYNTTGMSRQHFNKIINNREYCPKKITALQIAIGLHLNLEETQELLESAGYTLSHSDKRDVIVEYFLQKPNYQLGDIDAVLFDEGLACIGKY